MKVLIFGATGLVGQGILRQCLLDPDVTEVMSVGRHSVRHASRKLRELILPDLHEKDDIWSELDHFDVAFFCIGISSLGSSKATYKRITYDLTMSVASSLVRKHPEMTFVYISAAGARGNSRAHWARIKGEAENALTALPFKAVHCFRPAYVQAKHGAVSRTASYHIMEPLVAPLISVLSRYLPHWETSTEIIGRAALIVARDGFPRRVLENRDINGAAVSRPDLYPSLS